MLSKQVTPYAYAYIFHGKRGNRYVFLDVSDLTPEFKVFHLKSAFNKSSTVVYNDARLEQAGLSVETLIELRKLLKQHYEEHGSFKNITHFLTTINDLLMDYLFMEEL